MVERAAGSFQSMVASCVETKREALVRTDGSYAQAEKVGQSLVSCSTYIFVEGHFFWNASRFGNLTTDFAHNVTQQAFQGVVEVFFDAFDCCLQRGNSTSKWETGSTLCRGADEAVDSGQKKYKGSSKIHHG